MSIRLHSKLGINPRMVKMHCFACGQVKDDCIVLLGSANHKVQCPHCKVWVLGGVRYNENCPKCGTKRQCAWEQKELTDWEPIEQNGICTECQGYMKQGIILVSTKDGEAGENPYRTGGWVVVKEEAVRKMIPDQKIVDAACEKRLIFIHDEAWDKMGLPRER